ncbi:MAG TPA: hypothetical protein VFX58_13130 [Chitinophagaceae bacterium]|nr:hypothetical protein [Chitinophagaceae bacterium]
MTMLQVLKHSCLILTSLLANCLLTAQELNQVTFSGGAQLTYYSFLTDQGVLIRVSEDGKLLEWGKEIRAIYGDWYAPKLEPFAGGVIYYGSEGDSVSKGKVKMIGSCTISYYGPYENDTHKGKIRMIGTVLLDYYSQFENNVMKGRMKSIGTNRLEYYSVFEQESFRGKLKAIGPTPITYYSVFDDRHNAGKIKSIGNNKYAWYSSQDRRDMMGGLKSGYNRQRINGVTYILW